MNMKGSDSVSQFVALREQLLQEKSALESRLSEIEHALSLSGSHSGSGRSSGSGGSGGSSATKVPRHSTGSLVTVASPAVGPTATATAVTRGRSRRRSGGRRAQNSMSLEQAIMQATQKTRLPRQALVAAVQNIGYKFTAKDPLNSLSTVLYTSRKIKNYDGVFGPA